MKLVVTLVEQTVRIDSIIIESHVVNQFWLIEPIRPPRLGLFLRIQVFQDLSVGAQCSPVADIPYKEFLTVMSKTKHVCICCWVRYINMHGERFGK